MLKAEKDARKDEEWVCNSTVSRLETSKIFKGIEYRLGKQAYNLKGQKIEDKDMLPVFVKKSSLQKFNANWKKEVSVVLEQFS